MTMGSSSYVAKVGAPMVQDLKLKGVNYANKSSNLIYN